MGDRRGAQPGQSQEGLAHISARPNPARDTTALTGRSVSPQQPLGPVEAAMGDFLQDRSPQRGAESAFEGATADANAGGDVPDRYRQLMVGPDVGLRRSRNFIVGRRAARSGRDRDRWRLGIDDEVDDVKNLQGVPEGIEIGPVFDLGQDGVHRGFNAGDVGWRQDLRVVDRMPWSSSLWANSPLNWIHFSVQPVPGSGR